MNEQLTEEEDILEHFGVKGMTFSDDVEEDSLEHFGIKGMKWGITRNRDKPGPNRKPTSHKSTARQLSNDDLSSAVKRMNLEKQYSTLSTERTTKKGSQFLGQYEKQMTNMAVGAAVTGTAFVVKEVLWPMLKKKFTLA